VDVSTGAAVCVGVELRATSDGGPSPGLLPEPWQPDRKPGRLSSIKKTVLPNKEFNVIFYLLIQIKTY
jgi:hypothetical protein